MEKPEGLFYLEESAKCQHTQKSMHNMIEAAEIMKDMVKALSAYAADAFDSTSGADFDEFGSGKLARRVLKRFMEWK